MREESKVELLQIISFCITMITIVFIICLTIKDISYEDDVTKRLAITKGVSLNESN